MRPAKPKHSEMVRALIGAAPNRTQKMRFFPRECAKLGQVMKHSRPAALLSGLAVILGPWIWALFAVTREPKQGDAQGAFTFATYCSLISVPLGLVILAFALRKRA